MEENQQELIFKLSMFEQQIRQLQQQLQAVEQGITEITSLSMELDNLIGSEGKETLSMIGRGIFAKTKLISEELIVDVGGKNFVKKNIPKTKALIAEQVKKLEIIRVDLNKSLEEVGEEFTKTINEAQKQESKK